MMSKSYLLSFAKAKGNMAAVALAAILMAANTTVASAQNKATESNGTEKTVIGGVDDLYGIDPSATYCTDTNVGTNQTDGNRIVCFYNVGAKKFLSIGGMWGTQAALDVSPHSIYMYWNGGSKTYFLKSKVAGSSAGSYMGIAWEKFTQKMGYLWTEEILTGVIALSPLNKEKAIQKRTRYISSISLKKVISRHILMTRKKSAIIQAKLHLEPKNTTIRNGRL